MTDTIDLEMFDVVCNDYQGEESDDEIRSSNVSCDLIRKKINMYVATKQQTLGSFLLECGHVSHRSYGSFMSQKGRDKGRGNNMYWGALNFFARKDKADKLAKKSAKLVLKVNKRNISAVAESSAGDSLASLASNKRPNTNVTEDLQGDDFDADPYPKGLPVFDDCDEVRTKIAQCIQSVGMNQSKMAKALCMSPGAMSKFLSKKGKEVGAGSVVYYNGYHYFEKLRVANNQPKSASRLRNEAKVPGGFRLENPPTHMWVYTGPMENNPFLANLANLQQEAARAKLVTDLCGNGPVQV